MNNGVIIARLVSKTVLSNLSGNPTAFANEASLENQAMKDDYPKQPSTHLYIAQSSPWAVLEPYTKVVL